MNLLSIKLLLGSKGEEVCSRFASLQMRFPSLFPNGLLHKIGRYILGCPSSFLENRSTSFLSRLLLSWYRLTKDKPSNKTIGLEHSMPQIGIKFLSFTKDTFGIAVSIGNLKEDEGFDKKHILMGINNLLPAVRLIPDSYVYLYDYEQGIRHFYLEVKKMKGGLFSADAKKKLNKELVYELYERIERPPSLVLTENIEDLFKNIQRLSHEITHIHDLPQAMISCIEYSPKILKFLVVAVRVVHPTTLSISSLCSHLPSLIHFSIEKSFCVSKLRKKYPKEASVFTLELNHAAFLKDGNELNLREARQYIVKALENMLGPFRDFNGGLLSKENEQLAAIRSLIEKKDSSMSRLFIDLFYGIKPITMRALISPKMGLNLSSLLEKLWAQPLPTDEPYYLESLFSKDAHVVMIKTRHKEWKMSLSQRVLASSSQVAYSHLESDGYLYLCFFQEYGGGETLTDLVQKELKQYQKKSFTPHNQILRINFQGGDPCSLNPRLAWNLRCHILCTFLFEGLTRMKPSGEVEPAAAEKIDISPDGLHYTFHIRPTRWSNGEELTAYHFEKAWKRAIAENPTIFVNPDFFYPIKNASKVRQGVVPIEKIGVTSIDSKTLAVELEAPCPFFLKIVATPIYFPLPGDSEEPTQFNGPFVVAEWEKDHHLYLSQNPYYWNAANTKLGGVMITMVRDAPLFHKMFQDGELDLIGDPISPLSSHLLTSTEAKKHLISHDVSRVFWIHCNTKTHPIHHVMVRRALNLALNRKQLVDKVFIYQTPHTSPLPPKYSSIPGNIEGDPEQARACLQIALDELNLTLEDFPQLTITHSDLSFEKSLTQELTGQWRKVLGIPIVSRELPWNEFSAALDHSDFQLAGVLRRDLVNHPVSYLNFFNKPSNQCHTWANEEFDKLYTSLETDGHLKKMEQILIDEAPVIPLFNQVYFFMINERIKGIQWENNGCFNLTEAYVQNNNNTECHPYFHYISDSNAE